MLYTCMCIMTPGLSTLSRKQCQNTTETRGATSEIFISNDRHIVKISGSHQIIMLRQSKNYLAATLIVWLPRHFFLNLAPISFIDNCLIIVNTTEKQNTEVLTGVEFIDYLILILKCFAWQVLS